MKTRSPRAGSDLLRAKDQSRARDFAWAGPMLVTGRHDTVARPPAESRLGVIKFGVRRRLNPARVFRPRDRVQRNPRNTELDRIQHILSRSVNPSLTEPERPLCRERSSHPTAARASRPCGAEGRMIGARKSHEAMRCTVLRGSVTQNSLRAIVQIALFPDHPHRDTLM